MTQTWIFESFDKDDNIVDAIEHDCKFPERTKIYKSFNQQLDAGVIHGFKYSVKLK